MILRPETANDAAAIRALVADAFRQSPHGGGNEADIVDALRDDGALSVSLVAEVDGVLAGHVAFSGVLIDARNLDWYGLGPVAVTASLRRRGIGAALIKAGLERIKDLGGRGCVVLGEPAYYGRFGFACDPKLQLAGVPPEYFQRLVISGEPPGGLVTYHHAFDEA